MALEREDAPFHVSHWGVEDTSTTPHRIRETGFEPESQSNDSVMSDETTSASAVDVQMILEHDGLDLNESLLQPSAVVPLAATPVVEPNAGGLPDGFDHTLPQSLVNSLAGRQQISLGSDAPIMLAPAPAFTPRRSPRASTSLSNSRAGSMTPDSKAFNLFKAANMARASPKPQNTPQPGQARTFPVPEHIHSSAFREGFISSALPSPSLFQVTNEWASHDTMFNTGTGEGHSSHPDPEAVSPPATEYLQGTGNSGEYRGEGTHPLEMDVNMGAIDEEQPMLEAHTTDIQLDSPPASRPLSTPLPHSGVPDGLQFPSTADFSALFASPVPHMSQPVLSPFRLHQSLQSFSNPQLDKSSTPPPMTPPPTNAQDNTPMKPIFPMQSSPSNKAASPALSPLRLVYPVTPEKPPVPQLEGTPLETEQKDQDLITETAEPTSTNSTNGFLNLSLRLATPVRPVHGLGNSGSATRPMASLQGSLTPLLGPISTARLPFPITPQRTSQADFFTPVRDRDNIFAPVGNNSRYLSPAFAHASSNDNNIHTPSRIPVSVSTPGKGPPSSHSLLPPLEAVETRTDSQDATASRMNLLSPSMTSQLRQPSNLRNAVVGAASKIPRPGRKPYSKPTSRLPKPKALAKSSSIGSVASSKMSNPIMPASPIKTRRGRANLASSSTITQSRSAAVILPPDAIIYEPPAPRIRPKIQSPEAVLANEGLAGVEMDEEASSSRASPPVETGLSPPKSGLFLKSEARRLKEEVAINPPGSVIPQFSATAPSLGIFPSLARPKGKGRNTLLRPMMMPLDPTSLRNLTTSNTLRNQHYVCSKVETKVILKEGKRPASPTSKVKTILEKRKEEQEKSREERAARRIGKLAQINGDQEMADETPANRKHPRGAGDEEDYETPVKPERGDMDLDDDKGAPKRKRVKWDKDLLQRFELDETNLEGIRKAAEMAKARAATKGCLATQVLLDPLGNVPQADTPVANLVKEQVVVTKLVYIEDLPPSERPKRVAATKANARIGAS